MNRYIYSFIAAVLAAITIVSCNDERRSETYRLLEDVDSYIEARPDSALAVLEAPQQRKAKQRKIPIFVENQDFYFPLKRKKVRFTTAFGGAGGGANRCSKHLDLERVFFADSQYFA